MHGGPLLRRDQAADSEAFPMRAPNWVVALFLGLAGCQLPVTPPTPLETPTPCPLPTGVPQTLSVGDPVACLRDEDWFQAEAIVVEKTDHVAYVHETSRHATALHHWVPSEKGPVGYRLRFPGSRSSEEWVPETRIFVSPFLAQKQWRPGSAILQKRFGDFAPDQGTIVALAEKPGGSLKVRWAGNDREVWADPKDLFTSIQPARLEQLQPGLVVSRKPGYWGLVMGFQQGKVVLRQSASDELVSVEELQVLK